MATVIITITDLEEPGAEMCETDFEITSQNTPEELRSSEAYRVSQIFAQVFTQIAEQAGGTADVEYGTLEDCAKKGH